MSQSHGNVHPDLIRSPVHPWANHDNVHLDLILSSPDHPWSTVTLSHPGLILSPEHPWQPSRYPTQAPGIMGQNPNNVHLDLTVPQSKMRSSSHLFRP